MALFLCRRRGICHVMETRLEVHFPLGRIFRAERHFLLFKDQLAESGRQKTKENIIPRGKFHPVENGLNRGLFILGLSLI